MANKDRPQGLRPEGELKRSSEYTAGATIFPGDAVQLSADGKVDPAGATSVLIGVALSYAAADGDSVSVSDDPDQRYIVQADEAQIASQADVGLNANIVATAGDADYRNSRMELDSSSAAAAGATAPLKILGKDSRADNEYGAQVDLLVKINNHKLSGGTGTAGV